MLRPRRPLAGPRRAPAALGFACQAVQFTPDGMLLVGGAQLAVVDPATGEVRKRATVLDGASVYGFSRNGRWAVALGADERRARVLSTPGGQPFGVELARPEALRALSVSNSGQWLAFGWADGKVVKVVNVADGAPISPDLPAGGPTSTSFREDDGQLAVASWDGTVTTYDTRTWHAAVGAPGRPTIVGSGLHPGLARWVLVERVP